MARIRFPQALSVTRGGLFLLTLTTATGPAQAQVFFLQGQDGACSNTVNGDLTVTGQINASGVNAQSATVSDLSVTGVYALPPCPEGYEEDTSVFGGTHPEVHVCVHPVRGDEMVRVGDFWIDRYEASLWSGPGCTGTQYGAGSTDNYPAGFPDTGHATTPVYACSLPGVLPSTRMTWFQAQQACEAMGKRLCSNAEWQAAVSGTFDPGTAEGAGTAQCRIASTNTAPRQTGQAGATPASQFHCISRFGAEDMIGNLVEWVADWYGHPGWNGQADYMGTEYGSDGYWAGGPRYDTMPTCASDGSWRTYSPAFDGNGDTLGEYLGPSALLRGGGWYHATAAGAFAMNLHDGPSSWGQSGGARCCRGR